MAGVNLCVGTDSLATFQGTAPTGYSMNFIVQNLQSQPAGPEELRPVSQRRWIPRGDGTDGLELNLFTEMRAFAAAYPALAPEDILRMVTLNPARALNRAGDLGELSAGARADLIAIPFGGQPEQAHDAVLAHPGTVAGVMIDGRWERQPLMR